MPPESDDEVFRTGFGRVLTITIGALCALALVLTLIADGVGETLRVAPWLGLTVLVCWAVFWRPAVEVSDAGVTLINVTRRISIPWPALQEVDTQWALRLSTAYGRWSAWAAPAPGLKGAMASRRLGDVDDANVIGSPVTPMRGADHSTTLRPGDLPQTNSGSAATMVRRRWAKLRAAGHLDDPVLERDRPAVRWHLDTLAIATALIVIGILTALS